MSRAPGTQSPQRPSPSASTASPFPRPCSMPSTRGHREDGTSPSLSSSLMGASGPRGKFLLEVPAPSCRNGSELKILPLTQHSFHSPSPGHVPSKGRGSVPRGPPISLKLWLQHSLVPGEAEQVRSWEGTQKDPALDGPTFGLMLCCHCLEIRNNFGAWGLAFSLCSQSRV